MSVLARAAVIALAAVHLSFFVIEAVVYGLPFVQQWGVPQLRTGSDLPIAEQAAILRSLFVNQGVYNLILAGGAIAGLVLDARRPTAGGRTLIAFVGVVAVIAGVTLLLTTDFAALALVQAGVGVFVLVLARPGSGPGEPLRP